MNKSVTVADSDALIALVLENDPNHLKAVEASKNYIKNNISIVFPSTVFPEAITSLVRSLNEKEKAHLVNRQYQQGVFNVIYIDMEIQKEASRIFETAKSKQNTFFDALIAATAKKLSTNMIFSFDNWYPKLGFKLASS